MAVVVKTENRSGSVLVARPAIQSGFFHRSVVYVYEDSLDRGSAGVGLHLPTFYTAGDLASHLGMPVAHNGEQKIYMGGPVNRSTVYLFHHRDYRFTSTVDSLSQYTVSTDLSALASLLDGVVREPARLCLGISSWAPGQLQQEIDRGMWLTSDLNPVDLLAQNSRELYDHAVEMIGKAMWDQWI